MLPGASNLLKRGSKKFPYGLLCRFTKVERLFYCCAIYTHSDRSWNFDQRGLSKKKLRIRQKIRNITDDITYGQVII
jgi:hypothetical protein